MGPAGAADMTRNRSRVEQHLPVRLACATLDSGRPGAVSTAHNNGGPNSALTLSQVQDHANVLKFGSARKSLCNQQWVAGKTEALSAREWLRLTELQLSPAGF